METFSCYPPCTTLAFRHLGTALSTSSLPVLKSGRSARSTINWAILFVARVRSVALYSTRPLVQSESSNSLHSSTLIAFQHADLNGQHAIAHSHARAEPQAAARSSSAGISASARLGLPAATLPARCTRQGCTSCVVSACARGSAGARRGQSYVAVCTRWRQKLRQPEGSLLKG